MALDAPGTYPVGRGGGVGTIAGATFPAPATTYLGGTETFAYVVTYCDDYSPQPLYMYACAFY